MANAGYLCTWTAVVGGILSKIDVVSVKIATQTLSACWVVKSTKDRKLGLTSSVMQIFFFFNVTDTSMRTIDIPLPKMACI
jgi:hypothetical protein